MEIYLFPNYCTVKSTVESIYWIRMLPSRIVSVTRWDIFYMYSTSKVHIIN